MPLLTTNPALNKRLRQCIAAVQQRNGTAPVRVMFNLEFQTQGVDLPERLWRGVAAVEQRVEQLQRGALHAGDAAAEETQ